MSKSTIGLKLIMGTDGSATGYIDLPDHPILKEERWGCAKATKRLWDYAKYNLNIDIYLDYDADGVLIGIEILD